MPPKKTPAVKVAIGPPDDSHITTVGVRRPGFGTSGKPTSIRTNHFVAEIPEGIISHYDVVILPSEKVLPARLNMEIITTLQTKIAPQIFTPRAVYDGRKNLFASKELPFGQMKEFEVALEDAKVRADGKPPKIYKVRLNKVAEINTETLIRFLKGQQSHDNSVLTAITALNVVIRMEPTIKWPFNVRSFFTNLDTKVIGGGLVLWRGYFQSARPALGRMLINIDISTGTMFLPGRLIDVCLNFFGSNNPEILMVAGDRERIRLQRFLTGLRVNTDVGGNMSVRVISKLTSKGASDSSFALQGGGKKTVAAYFQETYNISLRYPKMWCVQVGTGAIVPMELCTVPPGQIMRRQVPPERTKSVLEFATKKPSDRLASIRDGLKVLAYGQSEYLRAFGMSVDREQKGPLSIKARVLPPPALKYGPGSKVSSIMPFDGVWNMAGKKFYQPCEIKGWCIVIFERKQRFGELPLQEMINGLQQSFRDVGIKLTARAPTFNWGNGQGDILQQLREAGAHYKTTGGPKGEFPTLLVVVLPEGATDIYTAVKHFGDIKTGVATQCLKATKCFRAKPQYYANVCLKVNVKLGGINTVPDAYSVPFLRDEANPTVVMGADVIHPAPGSEGRPSFTSLVCNVDSLNSKYVADTRVQTSRQEMIDDLEEMAFNLIGKYMAYRKNVERKNPAPRRIIFYRDGVSEGQFQTVLDTEVRRLKDACKRLGLEPQPKITVLVVGKRHHVRFFPSIGGVADGSGNCPAGTVVDQEVTNPVEFDFYLQSHAGLLGTSRPAHYNVLLDENNQSPDSLQQLSFVLCHVYARSTRSVSIPAPVYYADIVCSRAKNHYDPNASLRFSEEISQDPSGQSSANAKNLESFRSGFQPLHGTTARAMYFS